MVPCRDVFSLRKSQLGCSFHTVKQWGCFRFTTKTKVITLMVWPIITNTNEAMSQSELKAIHVTNVRCGKMHESKSQFVFLIDWSKTKARTIFLTLSWKPFWTMPKTSLGCFLLKLRLVPITYLWHLSLSDYGMIFFLHVFVSSTLNINYTALKNVLDFLQFIFKICTKHNLWCQIVFMLPEFLQSMWQCTSRACISAS